MSTPTTVNPQITDAVTQTNIRAAGDAAATSLAYLYQVAAIALGNAAHNAVNSQQQSDMLAQAATTQAVIQLLSIDTADSGPRIDGAKPADAAPAAVAAALPDAAPQLEQVARLAHIHGLDNATPWCDAARELMGVVADALRGFQKVTEATDMSMIKQAAAAAVLVHMIKAPDQLDQFQKILKLIEGL